MVLRMKPPSIFIKRHDSRRTSTRRESRTARHNRHAPEVFVQFSAGRYITAMSQAMHRMSGAAELRAPYLSRYFEGMGDLIRIMKPNGS